MAQTIFLRLDFSKPLQPLPQALQLLSLIRCDQILLLDPLKHLGQLAHTDIHTDAGSCYGLLELQVMIIGDTSM
ncbi:hypothetical protein CIPAW_05G058000 [Carya illinoinensis]|uniref:Uncharacterized protein n=1 Tax=Carya illinoinensis TaxID=32201 RepID=A0A8T1QG87_CARIL|nr:hypothetical protein CIPAW_05G058000 [Carya illinoinensis]